MFNTQNNKENLELLCAMRYCYDRAKYIKNWILTISIILPLVYMGYRYVKNILSIDLHYDNYLISISLVWIIIMYFMEQKVNEHIKNGAKIQEKFDIDIFEIENNDVLIYDDVNQEFIYDCVKKFKGNINELKNWYGNIEDENTPHKLKVLIAQRMNIIWSNELKKKYQTFLRILLIIMILIIVGLAIYFNMDFLNSLIFIIFPITPLFYIVIKNLDVLKKQIYSNQIINSKILQDCENIKAIDFLKRSRMYQDYIYIKNRLNSVLIPNLFYKLFRDEENRKLDEINKDLIQKYKKETK